MGKISETRAQLDALWQQHRTLAGELADMEAKYRALQSRKPLDEGEALAMQTLPLRAERLDLQRRDLERSIVWTQDHLKVLISQKADLERVIEGVEAQWAPLFRAITPLSMATGLARDTLESCNGSVPNEIRGAVFTLAGFIDTLQSRQRDLATLRGQLADLGE